MLPTIPHLVIARRNKALTRQSSGTIRQRPPSPWQPSHPTPCHCEEEQRPDTAIRRPLWVFHRIVPESRTTTRTGLPRPDDRLAMTAWWEASSSRDATHHPTLSLRGAKATRQSSERVGHLLQCPVISNDSFPNARIVTLLTSSAIRASFPPR
jgi:hypothetical protein